MNKSPVTNLLADRPAALPAEAVATLVVILHVRINRIVSIGCMVPAERHCPIEVREDIAKI